MPSPSGLASGLAGHWSKNVPSGAVTALNVAKEISGYMDTFMAPSGGTIVTAAGMALCGQELGDLWSSQLPSADLVGLKTATSINTLLSGAIITGGLYGFGPIIGMNMPSLASDLGDVLGKNLPSTDMVAQKVAQAVDLFVRSGTCLGSGTPTTGPAIGPPM